MATTYLLVKICTQSFHLSKKHSKCHSNDQWSMKCAIANGSIYWGHGVCELLVDGMTKRRRIQGAMAVQNDKDTTESCFED
jgi:hypothetical protein